MHQFDVHEFSFSKGIFIFIGKIAFVKNGDNEVTMQITRKVQLEYFSCFFFLLGKESIFTLCVRTVCLLVQLN